MSVRVSLRSGWLVALGVILGSGWIASSASAVPLTYSVVPSESNTVVGLSAGAVMDVNPDFTEVLPGGDDFPYLATLLSSSNTSPAPQSKVIADVGLPGAFNGGANGITFSDLSVLVAAPGTLVGFGFVSVPLNITGSSVQLVAFTANVSNLSIVLDSPFSSSLTPTGNTDEWLWAGLADVTISGTIGPVVSIPTQPDVTLGQFPFSQAVTIPLAGTFSGIPTGSQVALGIPLGVLQDQPLPLPPINVSLPLDVLGLVTGSFQLGNLVLAEFSSDVVYRNATPIPEPGTALLLGLGLAGLALRGRRRSC